MQTFLLGKAGRERARGLPLRRWALPTYAPPSFSHYRVNLTPVSIAPAGKLFGTSSYITSVIRNNAARATSGTSSGDRRHRSVRLQTCSKGVGDEDLEIFLSLQTVEIRFHGVREACRQVDVQKQPTLSSSFCTFSKTFRRANFYGLLLALSTIVPLPFSLLFLTQITVYSWDVLEFLLRVILFSPSVRSLKGNSNSGRRFLHEARRSKIPSGSFERESFRPLLTLKRKQELNA